MDPNRTILSGPPTGDPMKTQAMAPGSHVDPNKTSAMGPMAPEQALTVSIIPGREATMANGPAREQFLLELAGAGRQPDYGMGVGARTPLNLCLVIDRSGSMEGPPLEYAKQACSYVVDLLSPDDILSIVTFEETVDVLMPPQRVTNRQPIKDGIARLMPGNTTNLYDGMALAMAQIGQITDPGRATRMVVLSDGDPTAGIKDFPSLVSHAAEIKNRGVTCTFLGFGPDYNEELLAAMAKKSGGNYYYIPRPELIPEVFRTELEKLMTVVARNLRLDLKIARWVTLRSSQAMPDGPGDREFSFPLADLERGAALEQVFDFEFTNHPLGHYRVAGGRLSYDDCLTGRQETVDLDFVIEFTADQARYSVAVNPRVRQAADIASASKAIEKTIMGLKTQALSPGMAVAELQKTQALLLQEGRTAEAQEVTLALRAIQSGDAGTAEKTLIGTQLHLDQGKKPG
jgi:Ca-activated chloride channel family protein